MKIIDIVNSEKRDKDSLYLVHFIKTGDWWRAYEWSAYLSVMFTTKNGNPLNPIKRPLVENNVEYIYVGLQIKSFEKYFKGLIDAEKINLESNKITINLFDFFNSEDFSAYEEVLNKWKNSIKLSLKKEKKQINSDNKIKNINDSVKNKFGINELLNIIVNYKLVESNMIDNINFISNIQNYAFKLMMAKAS